MENKWQILSTLLTESGKDVLTPRQLRIVTLRFGLDGSRPKTLEEIGGVFGLTRERIRQILIKTTRRIRSRGSAKIKKNDLSHPCARFLLYLDEITPPFEEDNIEDVILFSKKELSCLLGYNLIFFLSSYLIFRFNGNHKKTVEILSPLKKILPQPNKSKSVQLERFWKVSCKDGTDNFKQFSSFEAAEKFLVKCSEDGIGVEFVGFSTFEDANNFAKKCNNDGVRVRLKKGDGKGTYVVKYL